MPDYTLTIDIDDQGLKTISAAGQLVTLVKTVRNGDNQVAWVSFYPQEKNVITWQENYQVYASTTNIQSGATIFTSSKHDAAGGNTYVFSKGFFDGGTPNQPPNTYRVKNSDPHFYIAGVQMITSGLYQAASVNGQSTQSPLNAAKVPYAEHGDFIPVEKLLVFVSSYQSNGLVISEVSDDALEVDFTNQVSQQIHYNDATNKFVPGPGPRPGR